MTGVAVASTRRRRSRHTGRGKTERSQEKKQAEPGISENIAIETIRGLKTIKNKLIPERRHILSQKEFEQRLEQIKVSKQRNRSSDDLEQITEMETNQALVRELCPLVLENKLDQNVKNSQGYALIHLAVKYSLGLLVFQLVQDPLLDPNLMYYGGRHKRYGDENFVFEGEGLIGFTIKRRNNFKKKTLTKLIDALRDHGCSLSANLSIFNIRTTLVKNLFGIDPAIRISNNGHFISKLEQKEGEAGHCANCHEIVSDQEPHFVNPANCDCVLHLECALNTMRTVLNNLNNKNVLERRIPRCHCGKEITPSFFSEFMTTLQDPKFIFQDLLNPANLAESFETYRQDIINFQAIDLDFINHRICSIMFRNHPYYCPCPQQSCQTGFILLHPDEEKFETCVTCQESSLFRGKNRIKTTKEERKLVKSLIKLKNFGGCPDCGKLIEKDYGCPSMFCLNCHTVFSWGERQKHRYQTHF